MIIPFLFLKEFLVCNCCFRLYSKIKKGSETSFWCKLSAWFFHKNAPYLILHSTQWTKFHCHNLFLSQGIKQNVLLSSYLDSWWCHKLKQWLKQGCQEEKEGQTKIQKYEYLENEKSFLDELFLKSIFIVCEGLPFGEK